MPLKLGPAGVPLSCKGRTIVEGMDDITALGLETMEIQTVRTVAPHHFDQYWQAGILSWKTGFEMNSMAPTMQNCWVTSASESDPIEDGGQSTGGQD